VKALLLLAALLALAGCGGGDGGEETQAAGLRDLPSLDRLREDFEAAEGKTRVLLLFAPL
jgi:ABC-type glycerol-3-phosphate transport system substrate-binding protein